MKDFSKIEYILMFGRPLQFAYKSLKRLKKIIKKKLLNDKKYKKYDFNNKQYIFAIFLVTSYQIFA